MNRWMPILVLTLFLAGAQGCVWVGDGSGVVGGSGEVDSQTRSVKDFSRINFSAPGTLVVKNGKKWSKYCFLLQNNHINEFLIKFWV